MNPASPAAAFSAVVTAIVLEAAPFLALGSLLGAFLEVLIGSDRLVRLCPRGRVGGVAFGLMAGFLLPTCECGSVPIARRLLGLGAPPQTVTAYMLAAPVLNPVVLWATYVAFRGDWWLIGGRAAVVGLTAAIIGWTVRDLDSRMLLRPGRTAGEPLACGHEHPEHDAHVNDAPTPAGRILHALRHAAADFLSMGALLILGAMAAALVKILIPAGLLSWFQDNLAGSILAMMLLAVLLSVCSEADAFVAASFSAFPGAAQLAFVALGPMLDLKLMAMYGATFAHRIWVMLVIIPPLIVFGAAMTFGFLFG